MTLKDSAENYEPIKTLNITDLDRVDLSWNTETKEGVNEKGESYTYEALHVNGMYYRIPNPVLEKIRDMLELKADLKFIKVTKTGTGIATRYTVKMVE